MAIVTLLQELFSGRAMRPAEGFGIMPVEQVHMPVRDLPVREPSEPAFAEAPRSVAKPAAANDAATQPRPTVLGEVTIERAAEKLIAGGASRAIFISPEGDEAAASAVLVAREVSDAGLRVLLLDLTSTGAASRPMLESIGYSGITNLLASEAQFSDVIHSDLYSDCHVIPVGTADPARAMRAIDRLPIIMNSLTTAYDVVVVECGPADADSIRRIVGDASEVLLSVIEAGDPTVHDTAVALRDNGYAQLTLVTPAGYVTPPAPIPGRSVA